MTNHGRPAVRACGPKRRFAIRAFLWSTVAFASVLLLSLKFRREVPEHTESWPIIQATSALADGFNGDANTALPISFDLPLENTQALPAPAVATPALNAEPAVARPLSSGLSAYLGIDTLTARAAAPVPEARVYVPPEVAPGPSLRQQVPAPAQSSSITTYEVLPKYTTTGATAEATPAASSFFAGWGQSRAPRNIAKANQKVPRSSAELHNASHWMRASSMVAPMAQRRAAATTAAAIAEPCSLRPVYIRRPLTEKQAKGGVPEPAFEPRPSCSHTLMASEVAVGILHCAKNENTRLKSVAETWAPSLLRAGDHHHVYHPNDLRAVLLASKGGVARKHHQQQHLKAPRSSRFPPSSLVIVDEAKDDYLSTLPKGLLGLLGMYERFPTAKWFAVTGDDVFVDPQALTTLLSAFNPREEWCLVDAGTAQRNKERNTAGSAWRIYGGAPVVTSNALTRRLVPFLKAFSANADRSFVHDVQFTRLMGLHGGGFAKITHLDGMYSQGPGVYLNCPLSPKGSCPLTPPQMPKGAAPSLLPKELTGAQWRPASFHHVTSDGYMRHLQALFSQAHACDAADSTLAQHMQQRTSSSTSMMIGASSKLGSSGRDALRGLVVGIAKTAKEHSPFGWPDLLPSAPKKKAAQTQQQRGQAFLLDMAKAQKKKTEKSEEAESSSDVWRRRLLRKMGRNSKAPSGDSSVKTKKAQQQAKVEHRPEALLAQLVEGHPEALWYLVAPFEDAYVDLRGAHLLVEKLCTGDFFFHGPSEGQISDEHVFQSLASGKGASSTEACAAAAAVPQLLVVASSEGGNGGGDLGLSLGTPFLASRGLAQMPSEQLRDLLGSSSAATRLMAAGIAVHRVPADRLALDNLAQHQEQSTNSTMKPFCAPVLSTKTDLSAMKYGYREAPRVLAHQVLRADPSGIGHMALRRAGA